MRVVAHKPVPVSSHPEADPEALHPSEAAVDSITKEDFAPATKKRPKRVPIVSINGTDVNSRELYRPRKKVA